jgi:hypothetical protein
MASVQTLWGVRRLPLPPSCFIEAGFTVPKHRQSLPLHRLTPQTLRRIWPG